MIYMEMNIAIISNYQVNGFVTRIIVRFVYQNTTLIIRHLLLGGIVQVVISSYIFMTMHVDHAANIIAFYPAILTARIANVCIVTIFIVLCISACYAISSLRLSTQITVKIMRANNVCMHQWSVVDFAQSVL